MNNPKPYAVSKTSNQLLMMIFNSYFF